MTHTPTITKTLLALLTAALSCAAAGAQSVRLREMSHARAHAPVHLADIAEVSGSREAFIDRVQAVVIAQDAQARAGGAAFFEVSIDDVRHALEAAGIATGRLALSGSTCVVRVRGGATLASHASARTTRTAMPEPAEETFAVIEPGATPTVRTQCAVMLASVLGVETGAVRVRFESRDREFLDAPRWGQRVSVEPTLALRSGGSSRTMIDVRVYAGDAIAERRTVRADVEVFGPVVVAADAIDRGEAVGAEQVRVEDQWTPAGGRRAYADLAEVVGQSAKSRIEAGRAVRMGDVERPVVVRRGDAIHAIAVMGSVEVQTRARALEDGRAGDYIECQVIGAERAFVARVDARGVVITGDSAAPGQHDQSRSGS